MNLMDIEEAIKRKAPDMSPGTPWRDTQIVEQKCERCGGQVLCVYDQLGFTDYYDTFAHICLNPACDFALHTSEFTCNVGGGRGGSISEKCRFCDRRLAVAW